MSKPLRYTIFLLVITLLVPLSAGEKKPSLKMAKREVQRWSKEMKNLERRYRQGRKKLAALQARRAELRRELIFYQRKQQQLARIQEKIEVRRITARLRYEQARKTVSLLEAWGKERAWWRREKTRLVKAQKLWVLEKRREEKYQKLWTSGRLALERMDYRRAAGDLEQAWKLYPRRWQTALKGASARTMLGQYSRALALLTAVPLKGKSRPQTLVQAEMRLGQVIQIQWKQALAAVQYGREKEALAGLANLRRLRRHIPRWKGPLKNLSPSSTKVRQALARLLQTKSPSQSTNPFGKNPSPGKKANPFGMVRSTNPFKKSNPNPFHRPPKKGTANPFEKGVKKKKNEKKTQNPFENK